MEDGFKTIDERFKTIDERFKNLEQNISAGFKRIDAKLDIIEMYVANHDNQLKKLPTREEFEKYQEGNVEFKHAIVKRLEKLEEPVAAQSSPPPLFKTPPFGRIGLQTPRPS